MLRRQLDLFFCALQFLTRIPMPALDRFEPGWTTRAVRYFPLVGQLVGGLSALVLVGAAYVWNGWVAALLATAASVLVTGALHEDGLADTADGLGGGATPGRRLEIMKDSRTGTYGFLALGLVLALKVAVLGGQPAFVAGAALLAAHGLARAAAVVVMRLTPYAPLGAAGKWAPAARGVTAGEAATAVALAAWPLALLPAETGLAGVAAGAAAAAVVALTARRLVGGHTGDVLGAVEQSFELGFLLGAAAVPIP
ncbi:MAG TPA: adenosylcobinamide-GDP ribazoletransferase [Caulobacteraceae bacterium]|jgi:adenosylcobinamide-GDP ribazoletransferase|nr:adenosylcobinamide-GDP ribazoletransferase [Caulobacteraceae bacterium]